MDRLGEGLRKSGRPKPRYDFHDRPHDWRDRWDQADVKSLKRLWSEGYTVIEMADWLGRTPGGVASKLHRLRRDEASW